MLAVPGDGGSTCRVSGSCLQNPSHAVKPWSNLQEYCAADQFFSELRKRHIETHPTITNKLTTLARRAIVAKRPTSLDHHRGRPELQALVAHGTSLEHPSLIAAPRAPVGNASQDH